MGSKPGEKIKYWLQILLLPIYWFSFLVPRNKHIWLFGSTFGRRFADNPRYFYLYLCAHPEEGIRPIWISHNPNVIKLLNEHSTDRKYEAYYIRASRIWYMASGSTIS